MPDFISFNMLRRAFRMFRTRMPATVLVWAAITPSFGQYPGYHTIVDSPEFKKKFLAESGNVHSIVCQFTQEKTLAALTEKITATGKFWFKRNNKVRLEYLKPFAYRMVMNGDRMQVRDGEKQNQVNLKSSKLFQQVNGIIVGCVQGTILDSRSFAVRVFENEKSILLELTPSAKALREFFKTILLVVDKKNYSVVSIEMDEPAGDSTVIFFSEKKLNEPISDEIFAF
jgi:outer membrane lipoprotein-sorting protein